ncbi:MAG: amino acid ABC transporter permease, partial [Merdibacter sp.]
MTFDLLKCWQIFQENIVMFMSGVQVTLIYAIIGTVAGFIIGLILGGIRALEINDSDSAAVKVLKRIGRLFTSLYIWVFRGTPMMVQAMFLYYGLQPI